MDIEARIDIKKSAIIIGLFTFLVIITGYLLVFKIGLQPEKRNVYEFKIDLLREQLSRSPQNEKVQQELAMVYYLNGKTEEALEIYDQILKQNSKDISALFYKGLIKTDLQQYKEAIPLLEKASKEDGGFQKNLLYYNLGVAYLNTGDSQKAVLNLNIAQKVDPGSAITYYYLGVAYQRLQEFSKARACFMEAQKIGGDLEGARRALEGNINYKI